MRARLDRSARQKRLAGADHRWSWRRAVEGPPRRRRPPAWPRRRRQRAPRPRRAAPSAPEKTLEIAYLSFAVANSYDAPMLAAAQAAAAAGNATLDVFDANNDPGPRSSSSRTRSPRASTTASSSSRSTAPASSRRQGRHRRRIKVVNIDQILGADITTAAPGRRPALERRVRPERDRAQDRRARRQGVRRLKPTRATSATSVRSRPPRSTSRCRKAFDKAIAPTRHQGRRRRASLLHAARASRPRRTCSRPTPTSTSSSAPTRPSTAPPGRQDSTDKVELVGYGGGAIAIQGIARRAVRHRRAAARDRGQLGAEQLIQAIRTGSRRRASTPRRPARRRRGHQGQRRQFLTLAEWPG